MQDLQTLSNPTPSSEAAPRRSPWVPVVVGAGLLLTALWALFLGVEAVRLLLWLFG